MSKEECVTCKKICQAAGNQNAPVTAEVISRVLLYILGSLGVRSRVNLQKKRSENSKKISWNMKEVRNVESLSMFYLVLFDKYK